MTRLTALLPFALALLLIGPAGAQDLTQPGARSHGVVQTPIEEAARPLRGPGADASRVRKMSHLGLNLGQEVAAVREVYPDLDLTAVHGTDAEELVRHYAAQLTTENGVELSLRFDREKRLYHIESTQVLRPGVAPTLLRQRVESKYGPADVAGRMGLGVFRIAYSDPRAELNVLADIALAGRDAPSTIRVELVDHALEAANDAAYRLEAAAQGRQPGPPPAGDTRVQL
ncbi:hypothetical protein CKO28_11255 [Rhodovibrio sodomensis]|uniref:Uncharacterized protein n=1 Tax=Rhodovibrio sodomensis TaxID=1088 RepID=A0ABS1DDW1_9PROT|nr:hypothetical protein [Rhodovibrio sodomensis]MBK1668610.1 hypothetical protein [Rhodovibrio sodomensis]